jgi:hypothetical protein
VVDNAPCEPAGSRRLAFFWKMLVRQRRMRRSIAFLIGAAWFGVAHAQVAGDDGVGSDEVAAASSAAAAPDDVADAVSFEVGVGLEHDSNVAVLELDSSTGAGDAAAVLELGVAYDRPADAKLDFGAGYNFSETMHEDFSAFDVRIHRGSARMSYDLGRLDLGSTLQHAVAELDGNEFLTLTQLSPYLSRLVGQRLFLRFAYADTDKDFAGNPGRDATTSSISSDAYVFVSGLNTYLVFGHRYDDEDAGNAEFDYTGQRLNLQLSQRFSLAARQITFRTYLRFENRDYRSVTPSIGAVRRDERRELEAVAEIPLGQRVVARVGLKRADNDSNLSAVDFGETVLSVRFNATL